ncbi:hypothetical protein B0H13DRAFT_1859381 [Mycena leptocephala]|nr:hypothetical protein B0H13DRAFT_1859381 [Mycena leptocephala]
MWCLEYLCSGAPLYDPSPTTPADCAPALAIGMPQNPHLEGNSHQVRQVALSRNSLTMTRLAHVDTAVVDNGAVLAKGLVKKQAELRHTHERKGSSSSGPAAARTLSPLAPSRLSSQAAPQREVPLRQVDCAVKDVLDDVKERTKEAPIVQARDHEAAERVKTECTYGRLSAIGARTPERLPLDIRVDSGHKDQT